MTPWPPSWAGFPEDIPVGLRLVEELRPFVASLHNKHLSSKTLRRHLDNLWVIGGEIIRKVNEYPSLRQSHPRCLLLDAVAYGHAPLVRDASETQQESCDSTARRLLAFLSSPV
jgi:hypothetical protein